MSNSTYMVQIITYLDDKLNLLIDASSKEKAIKNVLKVYSESTLIACYKIHNTVTPYLINRANNQKVRK